MDLRKAVEEVIRQPEGIEADLLSTLRYRRDLGPTESASTPGLLEVRDKEADLERSPPSHLISPP